MECNEQRICLAEFVGLRPMGTQYHPEFFAARVEKGLPQRGKLQPGVAECDGHSDLALATRMQELQNRLKFAKICRKIKGATL